MTFGDAGQAGHAASAAAVRAVIASAMLDGDDIVDSALGDITLRPHQCAAAARLVSLVAAHGGALLAEPVGLGKTYTALAAAVHVGGDLLIVAPAGLRAMWLESLARCGVTGSFVSHESLSRGTMPPPAAVMLVDEAHRLRSPSTRRYALLAEACRRSRVLLVTATPVQNRRTDLAAQLALFVGRRAWEMNDVELSSYVVRGADTAGSLRGVPAQRGPTQLSLETVDDCLDQILALPPPVPAKDESIAGALLTYGLVHQWTSSRAALIASLRRRRTRGLALLSAIESGRAPTRAELSAWTHLDDAVQLAFPELVTAAATDDDLDTDALVVALDRHAAAIDALIGRARRTPDPDVERAEILRGLRAAHPGERIIAFCHYAETVSALRSIMSRDAGVAALTAHGARVAGGRIPRDVVLRQFTPRGDRPDVGAAERIDLLVTTDLLSEGLNLQEASVVVHLDLPWNPARLDQRVGRVRRLGSRHAVISVYSIAPPASAARLLGIDARLRDKLRIAQRTVGVAGRILPSPLAALEIERGLAERSGAVDGRLREWHQGSTVGTPAAAGPAVAAVEAPAGGFLAVVRDADGTRILANVGKGPTVVAEDVEAAMTLAEGIGCTADDGRVAEAIAQIEQHLRGHRGSAAIDFGLAAAARSRRAALARVAQALARAPRHRRAQLAPLADAARTVATSALGEGAERILEALVRSELPDEAWLRSLATFGELNARPLGPPTPGRQGEAGIVAIIVFQPARFSPGRT